MEAFNTYRSLLLLMSTRPLCCVQIPQFYAPVPPAPAGLIWYEYAPGVPVLPNVSSVLGSAYSRYTWIYDSSYSTSSFQFSDLDKVRHDCRQRTCKHGNA